MIKKAIIYFIAFVFIILNIAYSATSDLEDNSILFVGGKGKGNFSSINDALDNSTDGDIIYVYNGSYNERIILNKSVILIGENKKSTVIDGFNNFNILSMFSSNVTIEGFLFRNSSNCIMISQGRKNILIQNNTFYNSSNGILSEEDCKNITVKYNLFMNNSEGIRFYNTSNSLISYNDFFDEGEGYGIIIRNRSNFNNICKNHIYFVGTGISNQGFSNNNLIKNNNISSNSRGIYASFSKYLFVYSNEFYNNSRYGMYIDNSAFFNLTNNSIIGNDFGIYLNSCYNYSDIESNIFSDNTQNIRVKDNPPIIRIPSFEMTVFIVLSLLSFMVFFIIIKKYEKT